MNVFLSYASDDRPRIRDIVNELKSKGIVEAHDKITDTSEIFISGSSVRGQVRKAIEAASKFVVVWSDAGGKSDWVNYEIGMAEALGKTILVIVPKGKISRLPPSNLEHSQIIELEDVR
jgi:hypothetical protein